jgi:hypothetical protein
MAITSNTSSELFDLIGISRYHLWAYMSGDVFSKISFIRPNWFHCLESTIFSLLSIVFVKKFREYLLLCWRKSNEIHPINTHSIIFISSIQQISLTNKMLKSLKLIWIVCCSSSKGHMTITILTFIFSIRMSCSFWSQWILY